MAHHGEVRYRGVLRNLFTLLIVFVTLICNSVGLYQEGTIETEEKWIFLARFCFLSDIGRLRFEVEYPKSFATQNLILYYDEPDQWPSVYPPDTARLLTCEEKESVLKPENHQVINLTTSYVWSGCVLVDTEPNEDYRLVLGDEQKFDCKGGRSFRSIRDRWWYIVLDNCNANHGLLMTYKLTMTNGEDWWHKHFSADQFGILATDLTFLFLFLGLFFCSVYVANILTNKSLFHTTYKMYMVVLFLYMVSLIFYIILYADYANDGTELSGLKFTARAFQSGADALFLLQLILMAKGYTITRGRLSHSGSVKITILMAIYCMLYAALFIYETYAFDAGEVLYLYESPAGYCLVALRALTWLWFIYAIFFTLKHYPEKISFYVPFFFFYTLWFLAMPIMTLIATFVMPKWWREKAMNAIELIIAFLAQLGFLILTRPSAANHNFPYHVRTSQIGVLNDPDGNMTNNIDSYTHHGVDANIFQVERPPNFTELFTVDQNVQINTRAQAYSKGHTNGHANGMSNGAEISTTVRTDRDLSSMFQAK
ncbi:transmembrane protein 145-like [Diadema antillarum]|uniref:transmembrane protein 145-like n=1 Tax=Diadema antillarum TaxID=105358 RepID=UPI003A8B53C9